MTSGTEPGVGQGDIHGLAAVITGFAGQAAFVLRRDSRISCAVGPRGAGCGLVFVGGAVKPERAVDATIVSFRGTARSQAFGLVPTRQAFLLLSRAVESLRRTQGEITRSG